MALVLMATHGWGTLFIDPDDLEAGVGLQSSFTNPADATAVTHYADDAGASPSTGPVTADANGRLMRYVEEGAYVQELPGGATLEVQAVSGATVAAAAAGVVYVHVRRFGAVGDGSDESAKIQEAIDYVEDAGGGTVAFAAATYRCNLTAKPKVRLLGDGMRSTTLKAVASSNTDVIKGKDFATLTGKAGAAGDYLLGCYEWEVAEMTIDGAKATQSANYGIRSWGRAIHLENVTIQNCKSGGLWTEYTLNDTFAATVVPYEGYSTFLECTYNDGDGWVHRGPSDWTSMRYVAFGNTGLAQRVETVPGDTGYIGGVHHLYIDSYLNTGGSVYASGSFCADAGAISGDTGVGLELASTAGSVRIGATMIFGGHTKQLILRGSNHTIRGQMARSTVCAIEVDGAINCDVYVHGDGHENVINVISETGNNTFKGRFDIPAAKKLVQAGSAAFATEDVVDLHAIGAGAGALGAAAHIQQLPTRVIKAGGWTMSLPQTFNTLIPGGWAAATYGTTVSIDAAQGVAWRITVTNGTAFTIAAPTNPDELGELELVILNSSGGAMGVITWAAQFKAFPWTNPANGKARTARFRAMGGSYYYMGGSEADL